MRKTSLLLVIFLLSTISIFLFSTTYTFSRSAKITEGTLVAYGKKGVELGACPLKHTDVRAEISGFMVRVNVIQEFENNFSQPIEAVYTFPLSQNAAVDDMTMKIGERTIRGRIMKRKEARKVYETAKAEGKTASLLDQERPNIFTQAVANILPNEKIIIEISYVETLKYEDGAYEFVFPMTIGPRYIPGSVKTEDAAKIAPPVAETRAGHDISISVDLNAGVPVEELRSTSHEIEAVNLSSNNAKISLKDFNTIPNKDFILRYDVTGKRIEDALLTHRDARGGFFTLILQPPDDFAVEDVTPKEIVFVLDTSGSMSGFPIEKAKEAMKMSLDGLYPHDTFNLITFAGDTSVLFDKPVPATQANLEKAQEFLATRQGYGGTEMMKAIRAALAPTGSQEHLRIVCFMTDGYVGNENEIIAEVQKYKNARVFSFGIGSSVNRYLLDKIAEEGNGEAEYVALTDDGSRAAKKFYERVRTPLLTDISIDWNGLPVADVYPNRLSDLFSAKPVILNGRYTRSASGTILLKGKVAGQDYVREIPVSLPESETDHDVLATLWARKKIDDLISKKLKYDSDEDEAYIELNKQMQNQITKIGLEYSLLTQFTSFVAVEEKTRTVSGKPKTVEVPVELPAGMKSPNGFQTSSNPHGFIFQTTAGRRNARGSGSGSGSGSATFNMSRSVANVDSLTLSIPPKTISSGVINGKAVSLPVPAYPAAARAVNAKGAVNVQVIIDENGNVISASAVSGHPLLRAVAEQAAQNSKFVPIILSGVPAKVTGVIVYNFVDTDNSATATIGEIHAQGIQKSMLTPEMQAEQERLEKERLAEQERLEKERLAEQERLARVAKYRQMLAEKLHFWIFAVMERLQKGETAVTPNEAKFVRDGNAGVEIHLAAASPEIVGKIKNLGFEITEGENSKVIGGKIAVEKLANLAEIPEVQLILPKMK